MGEIEIDEALVRALLREQHPDLAGLKLRKVAGDARRAWEQAVSAPVWQGPPLWLHGDLHPANVVVRDGTLSGVIDFGELCAGDPATDLSAAWLLLPAGTASRFFAGIRTRTTPRSRAPGAGPFSAPSI
jgi:aminoglycoside phosphotransferase (APT) family kinase protein